MIDNNAYYHVVEPIMDVATSKPVGFETLLRNNTASSSEELFNDARSKGIQTELDLLSLDKLIDEHFAKNRKAKLFLNLFPSTIVSPQFQQLLIDIKANNYTNLVIQVNENSDDQEVFNSQRFYDQLHNIRKAGLSIGIDDVGKGKATIQTLIKVQPDYIKLDKRFTQVLSEEKNNQRIITFFNDIATAFGANVILEGIETENDFTVAKQLNISLMQGSYFERTKVGA